MSVYQATGVPVGSAKLRIMVQQLNERIQLDPNNPLLYLQAGEQLDQAGFFQKAHEYLRKAEALDPTGAVIAEFSHRRYHDHHHHHREGCDVCDAVCGLCLLDSCCECMGGDIIECC